MEWSPNIDAGSWLLPLLTPAAGWDASMHSVVPRGFTAYARIFHPASRDRPITGEWPPEPYEKHRKQWDAFQAADPEILFEPVSWAETAKAMGTVMHPLAQWNRLIASRQQQEQEPRDAAGWRYSNPPQGDVDAATVFALAEHLTAATSTPDAGYIGVWPGRGGLVGALGTAGSRAFLQVGDDSEALETHNRMLESATKDPFNQVFAAPSWQPGILNKEISEGPRLELPGREYVLFRGGIAELARENWFLTVPWRDIVAEQYGFAPNALAPNLSWPDDHAWVQVTEVDYDSTIIAGSEELVTALCADSRIEAARIPADSNLGWESDEVNL